jgi:RNA polymerase sigma factor (sigma-70 family)
MTETPPVGEVPVNTAPPDSSSNRLRKEVEHWFLELRDPILQYLRALGCSQALAEEIAQEAFLRFHRGRRAGLQVNDVRAWVFSVVRNLWIDSRRKDQRFWTTPRQEEDRPDPPHIDSAPDPERQALERERMRLIAEEVLRLPALQRECLYLKSRGFRYREIAQALDIPITAAVDCVRRAVKRLRRRLND